jgi:transcriptional regulator with XRE-family HTH domain
MATQVEMAKRLGVSQQFLSRWKRGQSDIKISTAKRWGEALGVCPKELMFAPIEERPRVLGLRR